MAEIFVEVDILIFLPKFAKQVVELSPYVPRYNWCLILNLPEKFLELYDQKRSANVL